MKKAIFVLSILLLLGCEEVDYESTVNWNNYNHSVKERVDSNAINKDCTALQLEFDIADKNDNLQRKRTGEGNASLMGYIDQKMREAGCYS